MRAQTCVLRMVGVVAALVAGLLLVPDAARAHCDTLDGPVVKTAKAALEKGDVTPVLKWVQKEQEGQIREAFQKTMAVRAKGPEARDLADMYFFETLVRIHRAGEGAPYTGLKAAGTDTGPAVEGADKALETGTVDPLVKTATEAVAAGIRERFAKVTEARKQANSSVAAGRKFVQAYMEFVHYVEGVYGTVEGHGGHGDQARGTSTPAGHHVESPDTGQPAPRDKHGSTAGGHETPHPSE